MNARRERISGVTATNEYAGASAIGPVRAINEDAIGAFDGPGVFVVADGAYAQTAHKFGFGPPLDLGRRAAEWLVASFAPTDAHSYGERGGLDSLVAAATRVHARLATAAAEDSLWQGIAVDFVALRLAGSRAEFVHVGLSRLYRVREGRLLRLTLDHCLANEHLYCDPAPAILEYASAFANVAIRAVGGVELNVDAGSWAACPGDCYLLCTDGVHSMLSDAEILAEISRGGLLEATSDRVLDAVEGVGGENASALFVRYLGPG